MTARFDVEVSLALGADLTANPSTWSWTDITSYVLVREGGVQIRRGRANWQTSAQPSTCDLLIDNADGRFSRLNPLGAYYGQLQKNTPLRVRARAVGGAYTTRFVGYVSEFPVKWDPSEAHFWVPLHADGVLRRLGLGSKPIRSLSRLVADYWQTYFYPGFPTIIPQMVGYWPLEDSAGATQASSGLNSGGTPMAVVTGTVDFDGDTPPPGALAAPSIASASLRGVVQTPVQTIDATNPMWHVSCYFRATNNCQILTWEFGAGSVTLSISAGDLRLTASDGTTQTFSGSSSTVYTDGEWHAFQVDAFYGSATTSLLLGDVDNGLETCTILPTVTPGPVRAVQANPLAESALASVSHIMVGGPGTSDLPLTYTEMTGRPGITTFDNFRDLCVYQGIAYKTNPDELLVLADPDLDGVLMGTFPTGTMPQALDTIAAAEAGLITERLTGELGLDLRTSRENVSVALALDYNASHIKPPFEPTDDDSLTRNDVTVEVHDGGSGQVAVMSGPMGVDTIGRYDEQVTLDLYLPVQAYHAAGWRTGLGTVNEYRFPAVRLMFHSSASLLTNWLAADIGSRITIDNLPNELTYDDADQVLEGYTERINNFEWDAILNLSPYKPYKIFEIADTAADQNEWQGRLASDENAAIRSAITSSSTSIDIDPNRYRWATLLIKDSFTRSVSSSWGTPTELGIAYALDVGTAADFSVNGSVGLMSHPSAGVNHSQIIFAGPDVDCTIQFRLPSLPVGAGGSCVVVIRPRWTDANNHYEVRAAVDTSGNLVPSIRNRVGGAATFITTGTTMTLDTSKWYGLRVSIIGSTLRGKVWDTTSTEPDWQFATTDTNLTTGNFISILSVAPNVTNLPFQVQFDNFAVSGATGQPDDFNPLLPVRLGGETATIKGISTTAVTYVAAGAASHADNSGVTPAIFAGAQARDGIFLVGRIRGTVGTLATPSGYTLLKKFGGLYLWMKVHSGSESNPTVTPSGGSSGDTVSAFTFGFRGTPCSLTDLTDAIVDSSNVSNASAANIAYYGIYPWQQDGCVLLVIAGKSDDWTSAAISGGWTEIAEPTTTTGNDQSLYAAYQIQTQPAVANEGTITVTGGASAVSEAMTFAIAAGYQTLTVDTRSTNGVVKAHAAGTKIEVDTYVMGL